MKFKLQHVHYMPKELIPGVLYVSKEFDTAAHLCACGCHSKIRTPLGPTEWEVQETERGPTLRPSIGNWHLPCQSHYWITRGEVLWSSRWTPEQIAAGRSFEQAKRKAYFDTLDRKRSGVFRRFFSWLKGLFS